MTTSPTKLPMLTDPRWDRIDRPGPLTLKAEAARRDENIAAERVHDCERRLSELRRDANQPTARLRIPGAREDLQQAQDLLCAATAGRERVEATLREHADGERLYMKAVDTLTRGAFLAECEDDIAELVRIELDARTELYQRITARAAKHNEAVRAMEQLAKDIGIDRQCTIGVCLAHGGQRQCDKCPYAYPQNAVMEADARVAAARSKRGK